MLGEDLPGETQWCSWPYANNASGTCAIPPNLMHAAAGDIYWSWQNNESFRSNHPGGLHFAFADGSVRFIREDIDLEFYRALATIEGGEAVEGAITGRGPHGTRFPLASDSRKCSTWFLLTRTRRDGTDAAAYIQQISLPAYQEDKRLCD